MNFFRFPKDLCTVLASAALCSCAFAGVTNPNISVIGVMRAFTTNDSTDINHDRAQISFDETEIQADAALNPFANGVFVFSIADGKVDGKQLAFSVSRLWTTTGETMVNTYSGTLAGSTIKGKIHTELGGSPREDRNWEAKRE